LESWEERAFLTTVVPSRWNQRELMLADRFVVLPATLDGLRAVTTHFDAGTKPDLRELRARLKTLPAPENNSIPTIAQLKEYFAETAGFPWLCACAVYPELRWEITAYLATIPSLSAGTFTEESVLRLVALPWFRTGAFPDELRIDLLEELSTLDAAQHSSIEADARTAINTVWGSVSSLDSGSKADLRRQRMQLINELHLYRNDRSRVREIFAKLRGTVPAGTLARDVTVVRAASGFRISRLAHVLPDRLREKLFVGGEPLLGVRPSALAVPAFLLMATAAATWSFGKGARVDLTNFEVDPEVVVAPIGDSVTFRAFGKFSSADRRAAGVYWGVTGRGESRSPLILVDTTAAFGSTYKTVALRVSDPQGFKTDLVVRAGVGRNHAASTLYAVDNQRTDSAAVRASLLRPRTGVTGVWLDVDSAIAKLFPDVRTDGAMTLCGQTPNQNFTVSGSRFQTSDAGWVVARAKTTAGSIFMPIYVSNSTLDSNDMELLEPLDINAPDERTPSLDSKARLMNKDSLLRLKVLSWAEVAMLDSHISGTIEAASFASELSRKLTYQKTVTVTNDVLRDLEGCLGKTDVPLDMFDYLRSRLYFQFSRPSSLDVIWASAYGGVWKTASGLQYAFSLKIPQARDLGHLNATIKWTLINTGGNRELSAKVGTSATGSVTGMLDTAKRTATFAMVKSASDTLIGPDGYRLTFDSAFARLTGQTRKGTGSWVGNIDGRQGLLNNWDALADCNALRPSVRDLSLSLVEGQSVDVPAAGAASRLVALSPWYVDDMSRMPVSVSASGHITTNVSGATTVRFQCAGIRDSVRVRVQSSSLDPKVRAQLIQPSAFIYFDENKSDINTEARKILDQWAKLLTEQKNNSLTIDVTGNTQAIGSEKYNLKLGQDKADQAKAYLVGKGVAESRINARTVGESDPIASNTTDAGRRLNGRVVITPTGNRRGESAKF
ncbi:MAG: OmpA family protein, partial [Gemmatimonas sp.]